MSLDSDRELDDLKERLLLNEVKANDHEQKIALLLRAKKAGGLKTSLGEEEQPGAQVNSGVEIEEIIELLDKVKDDLRKELASKLETDSLEKRIKHLDNDMNSAFENLRNQKNDIFSNKDKIDGHTNLLKAHSDIINELQN